MKIVKAEGFFARLLGWLGRPQVPPDEALWLVPCRAVHTLGMRCPIDLVFLDRGGRVLRIDAAVKPWRCRWHRRAHSVLELASGAAAAIGVTAGQRLRHTRGIEWNALSSGVPVALLPLALAALVTLQPGQARAGAPLLEDPPASPPSAIEFQTEWKADADTLIDETVQGGAFVVPSGHIAAGASATHAATPSSRATLAPIRLLRPLAPETIARVLDEADSLYRGRHWAQALEAYRGLLELEPHNRLAWLRVGNVHHQRNQLALAASAYRKAALPLPAGAAVMPSDGLANGAASPGGGDEAAVRAKALANLAAVNLELARESLSELQTLRLPADSAAAGLRDHATADWRQLDQSARALDALPVLGERPASRVLETGGSDRPPAARSSLRAPSSASGQGARATVEYLRDAPAFAIGAARERALSPR